MSPMIAALDVPTIRNRVGFFVVDDWSPDFDVDFGHDVGRIHDDFFLWDARKSAKSPRVLSYVAGGLSGVKT